MSGSPEGSLTAELAEFVERTTFRDLSPDTVHAGRRAFVNIVGCWLSGAQHDIVQASMAAVLPYAGPPEAGVPGRPERVDILSACLFNGLSSGAYSFDDTHAQAIVHPTGAVASALIALAEQRPVTGADFLAALVLGVEVASRVCLAVSVGPAVGHIGWSQTGIAAGVGAAAAAARLLNLDAERMVCAMGLAALQAAGFRVAHGTMAATWIFGHAAQTGLRAAVLAQHGIDGPADPLAGKYGFTSLFATRAHLPYLTEGLGTNYAVQALTYKPYPCGIVIHPSVDAALAWHQEFGDRTTEIERIELHVHPSAVALGFRRHPANPVLAKVSLYHWVAAALLTGRAGLAEGGAELVRDPSIVALRDKITLTEDAELATDSAKLEVHLRDQLQRNYFVDHCKGSLGNPMSDDDLGAKFIGQATLVLPSSRAAALLEQCWRLDILDDVGSLVSLATPV